MITRKSLALFRNTNNFIKNIDKQYSKEFGQKGWKIGAILNVRKPNDYVSRTGDTAVLQATNEQYVPVTINQLWGQDLSFTSGELALSMDDFAERVLAPAVNALAGTVASIIMGGVEGQVSNIVGNVTAGVTGFINPDAFLEAGATLDILGAPTSDRNVILHPKSVAHGVNSMAGYFNPQAKIGEQWNKGSIVSDTLGFDEFWKDQTVLVHTTGAFTTGTISGANQTGSILTLYATSAALNLGDIVTFAGVNSVNRTTKTDSGQLQQFVITAAASLGATTVAIYPPLNPPVAGAPVAYQTVTASPADGAVVTPASPAGEKTYKNLALHKSAVTMVTADLELPGGTMEADRQAFDGLSIRMIRDFITKDNVDLTRLDILFGFAVVRPEWAVVVADKLS
jgi:hypothetical protein